MSIEEKFRDMQDYTDKLTKYVSELQERAGDNQLDYFSNLRKFSLETIKSLGIFYIGDATEMLLPNYLDMVEQFGVISPTNKRPIFHNRFVFPIKDINGKVLNLVGYSKEAAERYVYGTAKYYRRRETMFGLENLQLAYDMGYAILLEGITDAVCIRNLGFPNAFAMCGTHDSTFIVNQLNRCRYGVIKIPDRDSAGKRASKKWDCLRSVTLNTFIQFKDIDEMCRESPEFSDLAVQALNHCIGLIKQAEHRGFKSKQEVVTIV